MEGIFVTPGQKCFPTGVEHRGLYGCMEGKSPTMEASGSVDEGCLTRKTDTPWCKQAINFCCIKPLRFQGLSVTAADFILTNRLIKFHVLISSFLVEFKLYDPPPHLNWPVSETRFIISFLDRNMLIAGTLKLAEATEGFIIKLWRSHGLRRQKTRCV